MDQVVVRYSTGNRESTNPETPYHASFKIKTAAMSIRKDARYSRIDSQDIKQQSKRYLTLAAL
jgi:hypothetical protein